MRKIRKVLEFILDQLDDESFAIGSILGVLLAILFIAKNCEPLFLVLPFVWVMFPLYFVPKFSLGILLGFNFVIIGTISLAYNTSEIQINPMLLVTLFTLSFLVIILNIYVQENELIKY